MPPRKVPAKTTAANPKPAPAPEEAPKVDGGTRPAGIGTHPPMVYRNKRTGREFTVTDLDADLLSPAFIDAFYRDDRGEVRLVFRRAE